MADTQTDMITAYNEDKEEPQTSRDVVVITLLFWENESKLKFSVVWASKMYSYLM